MKLRYKLAIVSLFVLFIAFELSVIFLELASAQWLERALQGAAVFVALIASIIALHSSDRNPPPIKAEVHITDGPRDRIEHTREDTLFRLWQGLGHSITLFHSARVHFSVRNDSHITLHEPTLSFRLPSNRRHPHRPDGGEWVLTFNSNLYNSPENFRSLQFGDTTIISNSNLPFWNHGSELVIWIRMAVDAPDLAPFDVEVALNAENAQGYDKTLTIDPKSFLGA